MQLLLYFIFLFFIRFFSVVPFRLLYIISDFLNFLFYYVIKYRKRIILTNLQNSFPYKNKSGFSQLLHGVYKNLMDIVVESIKGLTMNHIEAVKRHKIINPELINYYFQKGQSIICVAGHYCNWEWGAFSTGMQIKHKVVALYKPLSNNYIDDYMRNKRAKALTTMASIYNTSDTFKNYSNQVCAFMMVADQSPSNLEKAYWLNFFHQDTAVLYGPEKHARINNFPVIFLDIQRQSRGFYTIRASLITENPSEISEGEITQLYMNKLEEMITKKPENWLWSHRRWKHKRNSN